ncbi:MAG: ATP-binding protein [Polaromonas sp.]|nr:ATP-binding protein [Polaromonas sp.]
MKSPNDKQTRSTAEINRLSKELRFLELADNTEDVYFSLDGETGAMLYISPAYERLWGLSCDSLYVNPDSYLDPVHPDDREAVAAAYEANRAGRSTEIEYRIVLPSGDIRWVRGHSHAVVGDGGKILRVVGTAHDFTVQKRADEALASTARALEMLSLSNRALTRMDSEPKLLAEVCRLAVEVGGYRMAWVGYAREDEERSIEPMAYAGHEAGYLSSTWLSWANEPVGTFGPVGDAIRRHQISEHHHLASLPDNVQWAQEALQRGYRSVLTVPLAYADQTFGVLALYSADELPARAEEVLLLQELANNLAFGIDSIRARHWRDQLEAAISKVAAGVSVQSGSNFFEHLVRNMADALGAQAAFVTRVLPGNPLMARQVAGVVDGELVDGFDYPVALSPCHKLIDEVSVTMSKNVHLLYPEVQTIFGVHAEAYVGHRLENSSGELAGMLFVMFHEPLKQTVLMVSTLQIFAARASAELKRLQADMEIRDLNASLEERVQQRTAQLKAANEELESFCYSVSHDLRSPLSAVDGFASLLEQSVEALPEPMAKKGQHYLQRVRAGVVQMGELIDALLSLARLARTPLRHDRVDLSDLATKVLVVLRERDPTRVVEAHVEPGLTATGDHRLLRQVFENLLGNAWKFSAGQPVTHITFGSETAANGDNVFFVRDNGAGFNMAYSQKLFGPFQRLHSPSEFEGTGIGLAFVQRIISRHGGRIWAESAPGQGATFRFTLGHLDPNGSGAEIVTPERA